MRSSWTEPKLLRASELREVERVALLTVDGEIIALTDPDGAPKV